MSFDYDLVAIGGTLAGIEAAIAAAKYQARVALVQPPESAVNVAPFSKGASAVRKTELFHLSFLSDSEFLRDIEANRQKLGIALEWSADVLESSTAEYSPAVLASLGIDAIADSGQFVSLPQLAFEVKGRKLISRTYLLAPSFHSAIPDIPGLKTTGYLTRETISQLLTQPLPQSAVIIGSDPSGIELAQILLRLGIAVTAIVPTARILPKEDPEVAQLLQAQLEAEGVRVLTHTRVTAVTEIKGKKRIETETGAIATEEIFLACGFQSDIDDLNLDAVGVKFYQTPLGRSAILNGKLQTTNRRIYGCGNLAGGYPLVNVAKYEARIAVKNALFFPLHTVDYVGIPWAFNTYPQLARVGLTEMQAKRRYDDAIVLRQYFKTIAGARLRGESTGFCKLLVRRNGEILGAHLVGPGAAELIHAFALAIQQGLKVDAIARLPHIWPSLSEINCETAELWKRSRFEGNSFLQRLLEIWFNWRR